MSTDITRLAHSIRPALAAQGISIKLGHTHQLIAAALGHNSLAAQQASGEPSEMDSSMYWLVDAEHVCARASMLGQVMNVGVFTNCLAATSRLVGGPQVYGSLEQLQDDLSVVVQDAAADDDEVGSRMAETNCTGPFMAYMEVASPLAEPLPPPGDVIVIDYEGTVDGDQDTDRPFSGDSVDVKAQVRLLLLGRRLTGQPEVEILEAALDWSWAVGDEADEADRAPTYSRAEALSVELGISLDDAAFVEDAEIISDTTSAGVPNGYLVDLTNCPPSAVVDQLVQQHGSAQIWVLGVAFDHLAPDFS